MALIGYRRPSGEVVPIEDEQFLDKPVFDKTATVRLNYIGDVPHYEIHEEGKFTGNFRGDGPIQHCNDRGFAVEWVNE